MATTNQSINPYLQNIPKLLKGATPLLSNLLSGRNVTAGSAGSLVNSLGGILGGFATPGSPTGGFIGSNLGNLAASQLFGAPLFGISGAALSQPTMAAAAGAMPAASNLGLSTILQGLGPAAALSTLWSGQQDFTNPISGYLASIPLVGMALGGLFEGIAGGTSKQDKAIKRTMGQITAGAEKRGGDLYRAMGITKPITFEDVLKPYTDKRGASAYNTDFIDELRRKGIFDAYDKQIQQLTNFGAKFGLVPLNKPGVSGRWGTGTEFEGVYTPAEMQTMYSLLGYDSPNPLSLQAMEAERKLKYFGIPFSAEDQKAVDYYRGYGMGSAAKMVEDEAVTKANVEAGRESSAALVPRDWQAGIEWGKKQEAWEAANPEHW